MNWSQNRLIEKLDRKWGGENFQIFWIIQIKSLLNYDCNKDKDEKECFLDAFVWTWYFRLNPSLINPRLKCVQIRINLYTWTALQLTLIFVVQIQRYSIVSDISINDDIEFFRSIVLKLDYAQNIQSQMAINNNFICKYIFKNKIYYWKNKIQIQI